MKKKMRYLAIAAAIAVLMSAGGCGKQEVVETATDVAAVESASDIVATASTTSQTEATTEVVTEIVTGAQGNTQVVTVTQAEGATTAKSDTKASTNGNSNVSPATKATAKTTKKTPAKATTTKATVKSTQKATTKATTKVTTKQSGLSKADYDWVLEEGTKYIKSLPKAKIDSSAAAYSSEQIYLFHHRTKESALKDLKECIDLEYNYFVGYGGIGMNLILSNDGEDYCFKLRYISYLN